MVRVVHPGSRIRMLTFYPSRIPDPGVKKAPDPGSGSATLILFMYMLVLLSRNDILLFSIFGHLTPGSGSGSVFSLKGWIRIKWTRIWITGSLSGNYVYCADLNLPWDCSLVCSLSAPATCLAWNGAGTRYRTYCTSILKSKIPLLRNRNYFLRLLRLLTSYRYGFGSTFDKFRLRI
jgi:hypothetical protein